MDKTWPIVLDGDSRHRGRQHGSILSEEINELCERYISKWVSETALSRSELFSYARKHDVYAREFAADLYEELEGIAEGARISFDEVLFLNCVPELRRLTNLGIVSTNKRRVNPRLPQTPSHSCTSIAASGAATADGHVYIGQTWDHEFYSKPVVFRMPATTDKPEHLVFSHPGWLGGSGINAAGLALVTTGLAAPDQIPGVPYNFVVRKALQQTRLGTMLDTIVLASRAVAMQYLVGTPFAVISVETSATKHHIEYIHDSIFSYANHFTSAELRHLCLNSSSNSPFRAGRAYQLLGENKGQLDTRLLMKIVSDHENYPDSLCCHSHQQWGEIQTVSAFVYKPIERSMLISDGNPCEEAFHELGLGADGRDGLET